MVQKFSVSIPCEVLHITAMHNEITWHWLGVFEALQGLHLLGSTLSTEKDHRNLH